MMYTRERGGGCAAKTLLGMNSLTESTAKYALESGGNVFVAVNGIEASIRPSGAALMKLFKILSLDVSFIFAGLIDVALHRYFLRLW